MVNPCPSWRSCSRMVTLLSYPNLTFSKRTGGGTMTYRIRAVHRCFKALQSATQPPFGGEKKPQFESSTDCTVYQTCQRCNAQHHTCGFHAPSPYWQQVSGTQQNRAEGFDWQYPTRGWSTRVLRHPTHALNKSSQFHCKQSMVICFLIVSI